MRKRRNGWLGLARFFRWPSAPPCWAISSLLIGLASVLNLWEWWTRSLPSTFSMIPSTSDDRRFGWVGIFRAASATASVPVIHPATSAIMWSRVVGNSSSGSTP